MNIDYNASIHDFTYVCFDLETTGLSPEKHSIIEIGAVKCNTSEVIDTYQTFVEIDGDVPTEATAIHGISKKMLIDQPKIQECLEHFLSMIDNSILVAHNIGFDFGFINAELARNGYSILQGIPMIDTVIVGRKTLPNLSSYKLNDLAKHYQIDLQKHHRALDDALSCREIMLKCCEDLSILGELSVSEILL